MNNPNRLWIIVTAVIAIAVIALGGLLGVAPQLAAIAAADASRESVEQQNAATRAEIEALKAQSEDLDSIRDQLDELGLAVPDNLELADIATTLNDIALLTGTGVSGLQVVGGVYYTPPTTAADGAVTRDPAIAADPTAGGLVTPENFVAIKTTFQVTAYDYNGFVNFAGALQTIKRVFSVTDISISYKKEDNAWLAIFTGYVYVLIDPNSAQTPADVVDGAGGEVVDGGTPTSTPTETPTPGATETPAPGDTGTPTPGATNTPTP